jgi:anti-sigma factor RsiW
MSECRRVAERLTEYVDDLLQGEERSHVEQHLDRCPPCRDHARAERGARTILRQRADGLLAGALPPGLRSRCEALASSRPADARLPGPFWRTRLVPVLLTVVVMVFMASAVFTLVTRQSDTVLAAQLTADHTKCFRLLGPPSDSPVDAGSLERSLSEQYGWNVHVPPSSAENGLELVGARRCLYGDGVIPHVMYRVRGRDLSLFVLPGAVRASADLVTLGHRSQVWSRSGSTFVLVSPVEAPDVDEVARYVMEEAR